MRAIIKREWDSMFHTMTAPVFIGVVLAFIGLYFSGYNMNGGYPYFSYALMSSMFVLLVAVPILTMRSFSEERKQKTDQILLTSPLRLSDIVLGKFFAMCGVLLVPLLFSCACPLIIKSIGTAYLATDYASIFAYFLIGCMFISIGMFISSLTESQVIAAVCTFAALLVVYMWGGIVGLLPATAAGSLAVLLAVVTVLCIVYYALTKNWLAALIAELVLAGAVVAAYLINKSMFVNLFENKLSDFAVTTIFDNFAFYNMFDLYGLIEVVVFTLVMLFLTGRSIQRRRWN